MEACYAVPFLYKKAYNYDIIFMDPPYEKGYVKETISLFQNDVMCNKERLFVVEHSKREIFDAPASEGWGTIATKRYGDTWISLYTLCSSIPFKGDTDET